jgi:hypothetical protein
VKKLSPIEISVKLDSSVGFLTEKVSSATTVPAWFGESIVKTQPRKESGHEMHGAMGGPQELVDRPTLSSREVSKLPSMRYGDGQQLSTSTREQRKLDGTPVFEKHYSVKELATLWNLSDRTIRRMFLGEPGVVEWGTCETRMKRGYKTLRVPESVAQRVYRRLRRAS